MALPPPPDGPPAACREARAALAAQLAGGPAMGPHPRAHVRGCEECAGAYRTGLETLAAGQRARRLERQESERARRRASHRARAVRAATGVPTRRAHLRLLLTSAFAIVLMTRLAPKPAAAAELRVLQGRARAAEADLAATAAIPLRRGAGCTTGEASAAELSLPGLRARLGAHSGVLLEEVRPARLRLLEGEIELTGACTLTTTRGVVDLLAGSVRLRAGASTVELDDAGARGWWTDATGRRPLGSAGVDATAAAR